MDGELLGCGSLSGADAGAREIKSQEDVQITLIMNRKQWDECLT